MLWDIFGMETENTGTSNASGSSDNNDSCLRSVQIEPSTSHRPNVHPLRNFRLPGTRDDSFLREGNPHYGFRMQLYCRTGFHLVIRENGAVGSVNEDLNPYAIFDFTSAGFKGLVQIRGVTSSLFLAMSKDGHLYGEADPRNPGTVFIESFFGGYNIYLSNKYKELGWYVAIKKSGKPKPGYKTKLGQKCIQFLPRRVHKLPDF